MPATSLVVQDAQYEELTDWKELLDEHGNPAKWGLYRWGRQGSDAGVWICLESNIGSNKRGSIYISRFETDESGKNPSRIATPYIAENVPELPQPNESQELYLCPGREGDLTAWAKIEVSWRQALAQRAINVDLIVDFGNTRTVVLMNEEPTVDNGAPAQEALVSIVKPVPFLGRDETYTGEEKDRHIMPSWFFNHQTQFASREPPMLKESDATPEEVLNLEGKVDYERRRIPQMFVEMSPVVVGQDAERVLGDIDLSEGGRYFLGSPKRYVWDNEKLESRGAAVFWCMKNNPWSEGQPVSPIAANVLRFMPGNGRDWDFETPPNEQPPAQRPKANPPEPLYPNADAMTWVALEIIENAYRQMNSSAFVQDNNPNIRRKLNSIQVTYPSGWTKAEIDAYESKWQKAVNIFAKNHLAGEERPVLEFPIDEATASQLPIVFADIINMGGEGDNWLKLIGRPPPNAQEGEFTHRARVMTIDIGGGTTDYAIIEYEDQQRGPGVILHAKLLFKDSNNTAGDELVLNLIERLLLPKLSTNLKTDEQKDAFRNLFKRGDAQARDREEWKRITRLVLIPKVHQWLEDLCQGRSPSHKHPEFHGPTLKKLNEYVEKEGLVGNLFDNDINVTEAEIEAIVKDTFHRLLEKFANYVSAFEVDQVILCGKPSEIPQIGKMLNETLPLLHQRILQAKGFDAGIWYPFAKAGKISDAKTVTAVGVSLKTAIQYGKINSWHIETSTSENLLANNYWVNMGSQDEDEDSILLKPDEDEKNPEVLINTYIGRRMLPGTNADQVYVVEWHGDQSDKPMKVKIGLRRKYVQGESEELELTRATSTGPDGEDLTDRVRLKLCTLSGDYHWIDKPSFDVQWEDEEDLDWYF
ncbi:MAG: hypothetical protein HOK49_01445 [Opitutae bacterium]|nr:hypothetical protein [Opitutae bacterium]